MIQNNRIIVLELKTGNKSDYDLAQLFNLTAYTDSQYLYWNEDIEQLDSAILDAIINIGSNYRHPLLFNVQVLPGDEIDAIIASGNNPRARSRSLKQRIRRIRNN